MHVRLHLIIRPVSKVFLDHRSSPFRQAPMRRNNLNMDTRLLHILVEPVRALRPMEHVLLDAVDAAAIRWGLFHAGFRLGGGAKGIFVD